MNVLVDTSVWSLALRRTARDLSPAGNAVVAELAELINEDRAKIFGLVRQELLSGIKTPGQFAKLQEILRAFPDEPLSTSDFEAAAAAGNQCRSKELAVSDMLICAVAQSPGWAIFSTDPDFKRYASVLPFSLHGIRK